MDFKGLADSMEVLKRSAQLRHMAWGCIAVAGLYVLLFGAAAIIDALGRWQVAP